MNKEQAQGVFEYNRLVIDEEGKWCIMSSFYDASETCSLRYEHGGNREGVPISGLSFSRWVKVQPTEDMKEEFHNSYNSFTREDGKITIHCKKGLWGVTEPTMFEALQAAFGLFSISKENGDYE